ncbi:acyl-CoA dehydrogenase family protein [Paracoccus sp. (in: a-proteobacteria)]|uniref:acyl-CoA dehydrogenase family protein n=1 Tax=Paracoccus sp. TaxID=267 RepID=UPI003A87D9AD
MTIHSSLSADEVELREAIARAAEVIARELPDSPDRFPRRAWRALSDTGLFALPFDAEHGGLDIRLTAVMRIFETIGETIPDNGFSFAACTHLCALGYPLHRFGTDEAKASLMSGVIDGSNIGAHAISEPDAGSAAFTMKTSADAVPGGWRLNGEKCYVSNAPFADTIVIYARTDQDASALSGFSAFLVRADTPGLTVSAPADKIGLKTAEFGALYLDGAFVPDTMVLGRPGMGYAILDNVMKYEVLLTFVTHLGQMQRRFDALRDFVRQRHQDDQRISSFQSVSNRVVDDFVRLETARMWLYRAGQALEQGGSALREVAIAKLLTSEANLELALDAVRLRGAAGYLAEAGLDTELIDAVGGVIYSGSSEIQRNRIAATLGL